MQDPGEAAGGPHAIVSGLRLCHAICCCREYYDDPAHANELHGVDKDKYVAGGCGQAPIQGTSIGGLDTWCCCGLTVVVRIGVAASTVLACVELNVAVMRQGPAHTCSLTEQGRYDCAWAPRC